MDHTNGKLIIVSNRGPNDFVWEDDHWEERAAADGLVSMIDPLARQADVSWFCCVSEPPTTSESRAALFTTAADQTDPEHHIVPVPLPSKIYHAYYGAISNEVLWMLQHHLVGQFGYSSLEGAPSCLDGGLPGSESPYRAGHCRFRDYSPRFPHSGLSPLSAAGVAA